MATILKEKKVELIVFATKWTWTDEAKPKGIGGQFGFTNLNLKGFVVVIKMR